MSLDGVNIDLFISLLLIGVLFTGLEILMVEQFHELRIEKNKKELRKKTRRIKFTIKSNNNTVKEFNKILYKDIIIGREAAFTQLSINDKYISSVHSKIILECNNVYIKDLNSNYGTFLNGNRIKEFTIVRDGDVLVLGNTEMIIYLSDFV
ncbi:hypothetical protein SH2C18_43290 [Clostridium sediminicola]|uniref:FHA domain-containing protein n=1 Tax=Clostridium sediminicola TaxID=3114879 RepID=UPI0031F1E06A